MGACSPVQISVAKKWWLVDLGVHKFFRSAADFLNPSPLIDRRPVNFLIINRPRAPTAARHEATAGVEPTHNAVLLAEMGPGPVEDWVWAESPGVDQVNSPTTRGPAATVLYTIGAATKGKTIMARIPIASAIVHGATVSPCPWALPANQR